MAEIPKTIPKEITDKYGIESNCLSLCPKNDPKDRIHIEIGDSKVPTEFMPQVKMMRWDNEVNFSVRLKSECFAGLAEVSFDKDKIIWEKGDAKIEYYDYTEGEGGYKMVWYLKSKPVTNKVEFSLQSKGLNFFYQPSLTVEFQSGYSNEFKRGIVVSETQVKDLNDLGGRALVNRPENVVGSYAAYHQTKGRMNDINGKEYKVGKAFHIYRPKLIDADGWEVWGNLNIDIEKGIYEVEIPQDFLDNAVYPIKSNDNFGNESSAGTEFVPSDNYLYGSVHSAPAGGTIQAIVCYIKGQYGTTGDWKGVTVLHSNLNIITDGVTEPDLNISTVWSWKTATYGTDPTIIGSTDYVLAIVTLLGGSSGDSVYDTGTTNQGHLDSSNSYSTPTNPTDATLYDRNYCIYATYTPSAEAVGPFPTHFNP